jgi:hypothetical protein
MKRKETIKHDITAYVKKIPSSTHIHIHKTQRNMKVTLRCNKVFRNHNIQKSKIYTLSKNKIKNAM